MSEQDERRVYSPLESEGGTTTISDAVVSRIVSMAAEEVEGVRPGGGASRGVSRVIGRAPGSSGTAPGVSVQVGKTEVAVDLRLGIRHGADLPDLTRQVREKVVNRVENLVGLAVKEVNVTVTDIVFPDQEERGGPRKSTAASGVSGAAADTRQEKAETETVPSGPSGTREGGVTRVEPSSRTHSEAESGPVPAEEVRVEDTPVERGETAEYDVTKERVKKRPVVDRSGREDGDKDKPRDDRSGS